ncbi:MAG TPA: WD40 repeat domain-containing protein [Oscillatoriaceae cyanobacterium M33_DOE_052]|uniref:WD40 repeat domain-containing protein n=1 Tax=Planktothricoides sp. SpSt-374 TaxID=2282167 RepID=A0A7C3VPX5_9CYAN|nr:WD40 repeat domain-containing protein [Oscillatoriaceae cyanobacterium M33_DOE_052]
MKFFITTLGWMAILATSPSLPVSPLPPIPPHRSTLTQTPSSWRQPQLVATIPGHTAPVASLAITPDGQTLISGGGSNDPTIQLWNLAQRKHIATLIGHKSRVLSLAITPDGQTLISGGDDALVNFWDMRSRQLVRTFAAHSSFVMSLKIAPDGQTLLSAALDGMKIWNIPQQQLMDSQLPFQPLYSVVISPDGTLAATGNKDGAIQLWTITPQCRGIGCLTPASPPAGTLKGHTAPASALAFTPDGTRLISGSYDQNIKIWHLNTDKVDTLPGHNSRIKSVAITPDGQTLASAGSDGIKIWNLSTGELLHSLNEGAAGVNALVFSPDGQLLITSGTQNTIKIWQGGNSDGKFTITAW